MLELEAAGRVYRIAAKSAGRPDSALDGWVAAERLALVHAAYDDVSASPEPRASLPIFVGSAFQGSREDAILALVRGWIECIGPFTAAELSATLSLPADEVAYALGQLENEGVVLRGSYRLGRGSR